MSKARSGTIALSLAIIGAIWSLVLLATGGFDVTLIGVTITAHDVTRPAAAAAIAFAVYLWARGPARVLAAVARRARAVDRRLARLTLSDRAAAAGAVLVAVVVAAVGVAWNSGVAGGADSYGYISQAELWRQGEWPIVPQPFAPQAPWPNAEWTFTPLGYAVAAGGGAIVATYSPGLPLVMAGVKTIFGHAAMFWIAPLAGAVLVLAAFEAGRRLSTPRAGLAAAWLVATSQALLGDLMVPTSDLLAAAGLSTGCVLLFRDSRIAIAAAGLAVAVALPVRPNLVLTAAVLPVVAAAGPAARRLDLEPTIGGRADLRDRRRARRGDPRVGQLAPSRIAVAVGLRRPAGYLPWQQLSGEPAAVPRRVSSRPRRGSRRSVLPRCSFLHGCSGHRSAIDRASCSSRRGSGV